MAGAAASNDYTPPTYPQTMGHPSPLWMLFMTEFWERFAFYGIRWALVLYMVAQFHAGNPSGEAPSNLIYGAYLAIVYAVCPDVEHDWRWVTPGSVVAVLLWMGLSLGFKVYVDHFSNYNAAYGSIAGVIVLMLWLYLTGVVILLGGEINAQIERAALALRSFSTQSAPKPPLLTPRAE